MPESPSTLNKKEAREAPRYSIDWPVELEDGSGRTVNISISGMYVECDVAVAEGDLMHFSVLLPKDNMVSKKLNCVGRAMRVEPRESGGCGVGIAMQGLQFRIAAH